MLILTHFFSHCRIGVRDEAEAARMACVAILHDDGVGDLNQTSKSNESNWMRGVRFHLAELRVVSLERLWNRH